MDKNQPEAANRTWLILVLVTFLLLTGLLVGWFLFKPDNKSNLPTTTPSAQTQTSEYKSIKGEIIKVDAPRANAKVSSPLTIKGEIKGNWSFEGSFPVSLQDANGKVLVESFATLNGEWMTTDYVPFTANLIFAQPSTTTGKIILKKDNPSDQRELDDSTEIPVQF